MNSYTYIFLATNLFCLASKHSIIDNQQVAASPFFSRPDSHNKRQQKITLANEALKYIIHNGY